MVELPAFKRPLGCLCLLHQTLSGTLSPKNLEALLLVVPCRAREGPEKVLGGLCAWTECVLKPTSFAEQTVLIGWLCGIAKQAFLLGATSVVSSH